MASHRPRLAVITTLALLTLSVMAFIVPQADSQDRPSYSQQIEPIFREKCASCHNHADRQGGLNLENYDSLMNGGKHGQSIERGRSRDSRLVKMIEGEIQPRMPIGGKLTEAEINLIRRWIDAGALGPDSTSTRSSVEASSDSLPTKAMATATIPDVKPVAPVSAAVSSLAFHPSGELIALGRYKEVGLIELKKQSAISRLTGHASHVRAVAFSPDGRSLAAAGGDPGQFGEIKIWDVAGRKEQLSLRGHRDNIYAIAFSPDGSTLATCSYDRLVKLWDTTTGREIKTLKDHTDAVFSLAFSPDGKRLASASADRTVKIWDVATGQRRYTLSDALDVVNTIAFHPSGRLLAGAGADRIIRLWELGENDGRQIKSLIAHEDAIIYLAFSPDGRRLVSTAADKRIKIWDSSNLDEIYTMEPQPDWVFALAFSPDGKRLAVGRYDGSIAIYDPATGRRISGQ